MSHPAVCAALILACGLAVAMPRAQAPETPRPRALWLWDPAPQLNDAAARAEFLAFCREHRIDTVWAQVGLSVDRSQVAQATGWRAFIGEAVRAGIAVHALDGDPRFALREHHGTVMQVVDAVLRFNRESAPAERFDGIHFDNEPYLLLGWLDPATRERILEQFLDLNAQIVTATREAGLRYGVDIPFWWQARDDATGEAIGIVTWRGVRKPASHHVIDLVDNVGIMAYRNTAAGPDGLIGLSSDLLRYADGAAKAKLYVGIETDTDTAMHWFITGVPRRALVDVITGRKRGVDVVNRIRPVALVDGQAVHLGVSVPTRPSAAEAADALGRLLDLARLFELPAAPPAAAAVAAIESDPDWTSAAADTIVDLAGRRSYAGARATRALNPKLTFAVKSNDEMARELAAAESQFAGHASYLGIAVHHYGSYRSRFGSR